MPAPNTPTPSGAPGPSGEFIPEEAKQAIQAAQTNQTNQQNQTTQHPPGQAKQAQQPSAQQAEPRPVGTITEELVKRPFSDIKNELRSFFSVANLLGINETQDDEAVKQKKKIMHQRFQQMSQQEQQLVQERFQREQQRKQQMEEERIAKEQQAQAEQANGAELPSSPQKGPVGPGGKSKKSSALQKLKQDRTTMSSVQSAN